MPIKVNPPVNPALKSSNRSYQRTMTRFDQIINRQLARPISNYQQYRASLAKARLVAKQAVHTQSVTVTRPTLNVLSASGQSAAVIDRKLSNTPLRGLGNAFKAAEDKTGVNAYVLASMAIHESGYGKSSIAKQKNNLFGFQAYDNSPFRSAKQFNSFEDSIFHVADYLSKHYLNPQGRYYNGTSLAAIGKRYASDPKWSAKVSRIANALMDDNAS